MTAASVNVGRHQQPGWLRTRDSRHRPYRNSAAYPRCRVPQVPDNIVFTGMRSTATRTILRYKFYRAGSTRKNLTDIGYMQRRLCFTIPAEPGRCSGRRRAQARGGESPNPRLRPNRSESGQLMASPALPCSAGSARVPGIVPAESNHASEPTPFNLEEPRDAKTRSRPVILGGRRRADHP